MGMITWICFLKMQRPVVQDTASACTQIRPASLGKEGVGEPERTQCGKQPGFLVELHPRVCCSWVLENNLVHGFLFLVSHIELCLGL